MQKHPLLGMVNRANEKNFHEAAEAVQAHIRANVDADEAQMLMTALAYRAHAILATKGAEGRLSRWVLATLNTEPRQERIPA